jgi:hypothetical protein
VERDDRRAVELLLRGGADPARLNSALETTAVHVAAAQAKTDILNMFIGKFFLDPIYFVLLIIFFNFPT